MPTTQTSSRATATSEQDVDRQRLQGSSSARRSARRPSSRRTSARMRRPRGSCTRCGGTLRRAVISAIAADPSGGLQCDERVEPRRKRAEARAAAPRAIRRVEAQSHCSQDGRPRRTRAVERVEQRLVAVEVDDDRVRRAVQSVARRRAASGRRRLPRSGTARAPSSPRTRRAARERPDEDPRHDDEVERHDPDEAPTPPEHPEVRRVGEQAPATKRVGEDRAERRGDEAGREARCPAGCRRASPRAPRAGRTRRGAR